MQHRAVVFTLALSAFALSPLGCTAGRAHDPDTGTGVHPGEDGGLMMQPDAYFAPVDMDIVTASAPSDAASMFGGTPDASRAPEIVYPLDQVVVPPNLQQLEFHYLPNGGTVFQLAVTAGMSHIRVYFGCPEVVGAGCAFLPDYDVWDVLSHASRGRGPVTYVLRSVDAAGHLGETASRTITFTQEDVTGGLYYWTPGFMGAINRFEFGVRGAHAERYLTLGNTGAHMCVGCHELSRDGTRIAVGTDTPTTTFQAFDVATRTRQFMLTGHGTGGLGGPQQSNFTSWAPDNSQIVGSALTGLRFLSGTDGSLVEDHVTGAAASMPTWSPDGEHVVYVAYPGRSVLGLFDETSIASGDIVRLDHVGGAWTVGPILAAHGSGNNVHPAYAPDGNWVVYQRSPSNIGSLGEDPNSGTSRIADAELWVVGTDGSSVAVRLDASHGLSDQWARFNPTVFHDQGHDLYWLVWASRRGYGLRLDEDTRSQLWMAAFQPSLAAAGQDPASVPFWVPFQDMSLANHLAQWVSTVERMTCTGNADCGGEFCVDGRCYEQVPGPM